MKCTVSSSRVCNILSWICAYISTRTRPHILRTGERDRCAGAARLVIIFFLSFRPGPLNWTSTPTVTNTHISTSPLALPTTKSRTTLSTFALFANERVYSHSCQEFTSQKYLSFRKPNSFFLFFCNSFIRKFTSSKYKLIQMSRVVVFLYSISSRNIQIEYVTLVT